MIGVVNLRRPVGTCVHRQLERADLAAGVGNRHAHAWVSGAPATAMMASSTPNTASSAPTMAACWSMSTISTMTSVCAWPYCPSATGEAAAGVAAPPPMLNVTIGNSLLT